MTPDNATKGRRNAMAQPPGQILEPILGRASGDSMDEATRRSGERLRAAGGYSAVAETTPRSRLRTSGRGPATLPGRRDPSSDRRAEVSAG